jgi:adenylylsulfate kinase
MKENRNNIFPVFDKTLTREDKEQLLKQHARTIWLTGLSGAGKTTLAKRLDEELYNKGFLSQILDGDNIRSGINNNLSFTNEDRTENIRRIAEVSKLFVNCGIITINSFISPTRDIRHLAMDIIGRENFIEVYVNAPLTVCEGRDVKGLYARARKGEIKDFTGIDSPFEPPLEADIELRTDELEVEESVARMLEYIIPEITHK